MLIAAYFILYVVVRAAGEQPRAIPLRHPFEDSPETMSLAVSQHLVIQLAEAISE